MSTGMDLNDYFPWSSPLNYGLITIELQHDIGSTDLSSVCPDIPNNVSSDRSSHKNL